MRRLSQFILAATLSVAAGTALSDPFVVGPWHGKESVYKSCVAHATVGEEPRQVLYFSLNPDYDVRVGLKRQGWGLSTKTRYTVTVGIDDAEVAKRSLRH